MDPLKQFIDDHRDRFDAAEPLAEGHLDRFAQRLDAEGLRPKGGRTASFEHRLLRSLATLAAAASLALLAMLRYADSLPTGIDRPAPLIAEASDDPFADAIFSDDEATDAPQSCAERRAELEEVRLYYGMQIDDLVGDIEDAYALRPSPEAKRIVDDSKALAREATRLADDTLRDFACSSSMIALVSTQLDDNVASLTEMLDRLRQLT
jgi:hypothetical protein